MKKIYKRLVSVVMAIVIAITCTSVAFAMENSTSDTSVTPRDLQIVQIGSTSDNVSEYKGEYTLTYPQYFTMVISTSTDITVIVQGQDGITQDIGVIKKYASGADGQYSMNYIGGKFPAGKYKYTIKIRQPQNSYSFYFVTTDSEYNVDMG